MKIAGLVHLIDEEDEVAKNEALMHLANNTDTPIRQNLQAKFTDCQNGIEITEFLTKLSSETADKWGIACLFYEMAVDNKVHLEELVKCVS